MMLSLNNSISNTVMLCLLLFLLSCRGNENNIIYSSYDDLDGKKEVLEINKVKEPIEGDSLLKHPNGEPQPKYRPYFHLSKDMLDDNVYYTDTVIVETSEELIQQIRSNRLIRLVDKEYVLRSSEYYQGLENGDATNLEDDQGLLIDSIKNLKIVGTGASKLLAYERNATVLKFSNSHNIHLDNVIIGHTEEPKYSCEQGVLRITYSYNINISNCKLFGSGTFGLITYAVYNLSFLNSEITECTSLIFHLERSRKVVFNNSRFHNNNLAVSVLGGSTNASREIAFLNCDFLDNTPKMPGNPAFNSMDMYESVLFENCTFKNNKGFKWYRDNIEVKNCKIDSSDFMGFY